MSDDRPDDLIEILRAANPVRDDEVPVASLDRVRARGRQLMTSQDTMTMYPVLRRRRRRAPIALGLALAATGALALALVVGHLPGPLPAGGADGGSSAAAGAAAGGAAGDGSSLACSDSYSIGALASRSLAFDGTVTAMSGESVTFTVNEAFRGVTGTSITLVGPAATDGVVTLAGGQTLVAGERYLVSGDDGSVWACGYTQPFDAGVAAAWRAALAR